MDSIEESSLWSPSIDGNWEVERAEHANYSERIWDLQDRMPRSFGRNDASIHHPRKTNGVVTLLTVDNNVISMALCRMSLAEQLNDIDEFLNFASAFSIDFSHF